MASVLIEKKASLLHLEASGQWLATTVRDIDSPLRDLNFHGVKSCVLDLEKISEIDTSGAWLVERVLRSLKSLNIPYELKTNNHNLRHILKLLKDFEYVKEPNFTQGAPVIKWIEDIGFAAENIVLNTYQLLLFLGHLIITLARCFLHPSKLRFVSIVSTINRVGMNAVPIVGLISFLIGIVLVFQGSFQLRKFGAEIYTVDLLAISLLREIGILMTAIMVAGRSGSAFAAQIGTMKLNQEIDALNTFGLDPMEVLVVPRVIALVIAMPLLAFISDIIGLAGGAIMSYLTLDIPFSQYLQQLNQSFQPMTFWVGIIKAPVFGFIIAMIGCFEGMQVHGGALSVGRKTTKAVVESIFLIVVADAIFSILFTQLDL
jgi:phospholipid/cholesterol/gamma-HCH transport system permease protein